MQSKVKLITTTSIVDGIDIERYHGVVSARVVAATNIFSDIMADFSDVFGGKSVTYQKQLKSIYDEAIVLLSEEAAKLGANLVLGLKVDHNEISGRNKQMFFVTATGTAATASSLSVEPTSPPDDVSRQVTGQ
ncbi:YbjQ family protein [Paenibacillus cymbidii]|uniref:YbjQ family protein n=1 Tax=Paenibacillus cymbidii TaxID=1639034 RepID=UPI0014366FC3|nr:heavy metal-binding domain-containing protein [Paenibacillus cymbidii]